MISIIGLTIWASVWIYFGVVLSWEYDEDSQYAAMIHFITSAVALFVAGKILHIQLM
jgi:membrane protein DedA with SNARE-associated domain